MLHRSALLAVALVVLAAAGAQAATVHTIRTNGDGWITRIGELRTRTSPPTFEKARAAFGRPTEVAPLGGDSACRIVWRRLRLRTVFANFGGGRACAPSVGLFQSGTIRSRRFRTARGLRVGDRSSTIKQKHPGAVFRRNVWWIARAESPYGEEATEIPTIEAIVSGGRVRVLRLWVGGAGD